MNKANYFKILTPIIMVIFCINLSKAQSNVVPPPADLIGKWKMVDINAIDTLGNANVSESTALLEDAVTNNVFEYDITDSTFTLIINGNSVGTCNYVFTDGNAVVFDAEGAGLSDIVKDIKVVSVTSTNLELKSALPDGDFSYKREYLTKQQ